MRDDRRPPDGIPSDPADFARHLPSEGGRVGALAIPGISRLQRSEQQDSPTRQAKRVVLGGFTRLYLETHVRRRLLEISRCPRARALGTTEQAERLDALAGRLESHAQRVAGWGRLRAATAKLPVISAALPLVNGIVAGAAIGTGSWDDVAGVLPLIAGTALAALIALVVVWLPSVEYGFTTKRALLGGGSLPAERRYLTHDGGSLARRHRAEGNRGDREEPRHSEYEHRDTEDHDENVPTRPDG